MTATQLARLVSFSIGMTLLVPTGAFAQGTRPSTLSVDVGSEGSVSGDILTGATGTLSGTPSGVDPTSYDAVFGRGLYWGVDVGYNLSNTGEIRVRTTYTRWAGRSSTPIGSVGTPPLSVAFDDYKALGVDAGFRASFTSWDSRVRPFVGSTLGATRV